MKTFLRSATLIGLLATTSIALAQGPGRGRGGPPPEPGLMTYELAEQAMAAAVDYTNDNGWAMTIRIVDQNDNVVMLHRVNDVNPFTVGVAERKTMTVIRTKMTSQEYADKTAAGEMERFENDANFGGGVPVFLDGQLIGAIAASGGSPADDEEVAVAGVEAIGGSISME
jgi:uncharacterized protein GlcG (DUF336 family)